MITTDNECISHPFIYIPLFLSPFHTAFSSPRNYASRINDINTKCLYDFDKIHTTSDLGSYTPSHPLPPPLATAPYW